MSNHTPNNGWISVNDRLPDCNGKYLVAYHPAYWDNVHYNDCRKHLERRLINGTIF